MTRSAAKVDNRERSRKDRNQQVWLTTIEQLKQKWPILTDPAFSGGHLMLRVDGANGTAGAVRVTVEEYIPPPK